MEITTNTPKTSIKQKVLQIFSSISNKFKDVTIELTQKIQWTTYSELWDFIKQFTIVTIFSIVCLFIIDNIIIYILKKIF